MKIPGIKQPCGIWKKLSGRRGTTLGEMLVAVLILLMLTMVVAGGTGIAVKVYRSEKAYSGSRVLANTVLLAMTEELRYASGLTVGEDGTSVSYDSRSYGAGTTMKLESQGVGEGGLIKMCIRDRDHIRFSFKWLFGISLVMLLAGFLLGVIQL